MYGSSLRARGKKGLVIGCAMAHRANRIAFALVRDQAGYDPQQVDPRGLTEPSTTLVGTEGTAPADKRQVQ